MTRPQPRTGVLSADRSQGKTSPRGFPFPAPLKHLSAKGPRLNPNTPTKGRAQARAGTKYVIALQGVTSGGGVR